MKKTKYDSFLNGKLPDGCKLCVKGKKMVLFVTGECSRGCKFCPLSNARKNIDQIYSNERPINDFNEIIKEVKISHAKGCSLTGGDPLLKLHRTLDLAKMLKKTFGKNFHIHIYVSTKLVDEKVLKLLSLNIDEIRFHPDLDKDLDIEIEKISLASKFWKKKNIGIEIPCFPNKEKEIIKLIKKSQPFVSFLNLNELESGEFSEKIMAKEYEISEDGYTIKNSINFGKNLIKKLELISPKLNIHLCTARLKNWHQYRNRLKNYSIPKFSKMTDEGTIIYFSTKDFQVKNLLKVKDYFFDERKNQFIMNPRKLNLASNLKLFKIEEYPTFDREECEVEELL